jgi:hypothetical protein
MSSSFGILFSIRIAHSYYAQKCDDFEFILPADSAALARNGKILTRMNEGIFYALCEKDEGGNPRVPITGLTLRIGLQLKNPHFSNFTQLDFPQGTHPLFANIVSATALDPGSSVFLTGPLFAHALSRVNRPVTFTIKDSAGTAIITSIVNNPDDQSPVPVDLREYAPGAYSITEKYSGSTKKVDYYLDAELLKMNTFAVVEIKIDSSFYAGNPPEFVVSFNARQETLKYYIVGRNYSASDLNNVLVSDAGALEEGRPQVLFTRVNQGSFTSNDISPSLLTDSNSRVVLFKSQAAVSRLERPRKKIQLSKSSDVIIKHLAQPGVDQSTSDMIIQISKP